MAIQENIEFNADFNNALKDIKSFTKDAAAQINKVSDAFSFLKTVAAAAVAVFAGREVISGIEAIVDASAHQEEALNSLNTALALTGDYSAEASKSMQAFAAQIQKTTKFDDDLVISQIAVAKQFGLSNENAQKLVKTATDLASATGVSLDSAVQELGRTLTGTTGTLGKTIPGIKELGVEALKSGAAIDLIAQRFGGAANASINTFSGSLAQLKNTFSDFLEELGNAIVKNPVVIAAFQVLTDIIGRFTQLVADNQGVLKELVGNLIKLGFDAIPIVLEGVKSLVEIFSDFIKIVILSTKGNIELLKVLLQFDSAKAVINAFYKGFLALSQVFLDAFKGLSQILSLLPGFEKKGLAIEKTIQGIQDGLDGAIESGVDFRKVNNVLDNTDKALDGITAGVTGFTKTAVTGLDKSITYTQQLAASMANVSTQTAEATAVFEKLNSSAGGFSFKDFTKKIGDAFKIGAGYVVDAIAGISTVVGGIFSGDYINKFANFIKQIGEIPKVILDAMKNLTGIIDGLLEQLPNYIKQFLAEIPKLTDHFVASFPKLVDTLLAAIPKVIDTLSNTVGPITQTIVNAISKVIDAIPAIIDRTIQELPNFIDIILKGLPSIITAILQAIPKIVTSIVRILPQLVQVISDDLPDIVTALVEGIIGASGDIALALIDALITKGGIQRMTEATIKATPKIAVALVKAIIAGSKDSSLQLINYIGKILTDIFGGLFKGDLRDFWTGKKFYEGVVALFQNEEVRDYLNGKKFSDSMTALFANADLRDTLSGKKFYDSVLALLQNDDLKDIFTGKKLYDSIRNAFSNLDLIDQLKDILRNPPFLDKLKSLLSAGIGGGGGKGGIKIPGFADGGQVFGVPSGFPNDSFPARLTSGELVVDSSTAQKLTSFLDGKGGAGGLDLNALANIINARPMVVNVQVSEQQLAQAVFNAKRRGYRI